MLILSRMAEDGLSLLDEGTLIIDGHGTDETVEGPKIYKRDGSYYIQVGVANDKTRPHACKAEIMEQMYYWWYRED